MVRILEIKECCRIIDAGAGRPARGPVHHREPQVRAAAAPRAGDQHGGADPPLQARHRGLPRPAGRGLLPDRVAARRARLLRARRRLLQARARAHARPLVREPAGASGRWSGTSTSPTSSRRSACSTRCSGASTADGASTRPRSAATSTAAASPAGTRPPTSPRTRPSSPTRRRRRCRTSCARRSRTYMSRYPDFRSAAIPALHAAQRLHGWCSPTAIEQVACVMRLTPGYLTAVATFYDMFETAPEGRAHDVYVCTNISCSLRGADALYEAMLDAAGDDPHFHVQVVRVPRRVRHRADGVGQRRVRRPARRPTTAGRSSTTSGPGGRCSRPSSSRQPPDGATAQEDRRCSSSSTTSTSPGCNTLDGLPARARRLRDAAHARSRWSPPTCSPSSRRPACAAAAAPASRWARRRRSCPRATWTSTSSATRTSPSRGRSRTAS